MNADKTIAFKLNELNGKNKKLDSFSFFGGRYLLYFMVLLMPIIAYFKMDYNMVIPTIAFCIFWIISWLISLSFGAIIRRPRPYVKFPEKIIPMYKPIFEKWKSMPSDHAMTSAVVVMCTFLIEAPVVTVIYILLAVWVCWGRMYAGVHFLSDILAGLFLGTLIPGLFLLFYLFLFSPV